MEEYQDEQDVELEVFVKKLMMSLSIPNGCITDESIVNTPRRVAKSLRELTSGYKESLQDIFSGAILSFESTQTITIANIHFNSLCEHHLLPFWGTVEISYEPDGRILGLSKFPRIVNVFSKRLQIQERLTQEIAATLMHCLNPFSVKVKIDAIHACVEFRGVMKRGISTITETVLKKSDY